MLPERASASQQGKPTGTVNLSRYEREKKGKRGLRDEVEIVMLNYVSGLRVAVI